MLSVLPALIPVVGILDPLLFTDITTDGLDDVGLNQDRLSSSWQSSQR